MTDNDIFTAIKAAIGTGLNARGYSNVQICQSNQPIQEGIFSSPAVYFTKITDHRYGFLQSEDIYDTVDQVIKHTELQMYESTYQVNALVTQDVYSTTGLTASDLVNITASVLASDVTRLALSALGLNILRILDVTNPYFVNDKDRFQASPSFDFDLTYEQVNITITPFLQTITFDIHHV